MWVSAVLKQRVDKKWSLDDEVTIGKFDTCISIINCRVNFAHTSDATIENIEFFIRNKQMTKAEKREKVSGVLRATGVCFFIFSITVPDNVFRSEVLTFSPMKFSTNLKYLFWTMKKNQTPEGKASKFKETVSKLPQPL